MPQYTSRDNITYNIPNWTGVSYKAAVINAAYANRQFVVVNICGCTTIMFNCFWCKRFITSAGVQGDHVVGQKLGNGNNEELQALFEEAEEDGDNLVLSCSECNGGTRNKQGRMTRSAYKKDRDSQMIID